MRALKIWFSVLVLSLWSSKVDASQNLTAGDQLPRYSTATQGEIFDLTDSNGEPVNNFDTVSLNDDVMSNILLQTLTHFARERIPARFVHAKGTGAFGYFEVTHDISHICKAKVFNGVGKKTSVAVRFSNQNGGPGGPDTSVDSRGFAIKFYTEEGNLDLLGINFEYFNIKDALYFNSLIHSLNPNPQTGLNDANSNWDFHTSRPETVLFLMDVFGDPGVPNGFRHMSGYPIHTFQVYNDHGNISYIRFAFEPDVGNQYLPASEATRLAGEDPEYYAKDLYEAILNGNFPSWTINIQYMSPEDIKKADFNPFDVTLEWPKKQYPQRPIGKLVLNENLKNHFAESELISYNVGNLVPGISGGGDRMFEARRLAYFEAANYRLGANLYKIPVNCPMSGANTYLRDGVPPVGDNEGNAPNYFPNSFNGPVPYNDTSRPKLIKHYVAPEAENFRQARDKYENELTEAAKGRLIDMIVNRLVFAKDFLQKRAIDMFTKVHPDFGQRVANGLEKASKSGVKKPVSIND